MLDTPTLIVNVGIHILILGIFLAVFFFLYVSKLTKEHIEDEFRNIVDSTVDQYLSKLPASTPITTWEALKARVDGIKIPIDQAVAANNKQIQKLTYQILAGYFVIVLGVTFALRKEISLGAILLDNFLVFLCVGIIEYQFFKHIASKYIPVTPDTLKIVVIDRVLDKLAAGK